METGGSASTAGSSASEKFRITSAGKVGIGTASPSVPLDVVGTLKVGASSGGRYFNLINDSANSYLDVSHGLVFRTNGASSLATAMTIGSVGGIAITGDFHDSATADESNYQISFGGDSTSSPRWGFRVGTSSDSENLYLDRNLSGTPANALKIEKGDGTVAIPGSLQVTGVLTNTTRVQITKDSTSAILRVHNTHGSGPLGIDIAFLGAEPNNANQWFIQGRDASADEFKIFSDGSYSQISDISVKENISEVDSMIGKINELRVVNYNRKRDVSKKNHVGIIAQELEEVFPHLISKNDDDTLMVYKIGLVMPLIKAVQELSAKVEALENA